MDWRYRKSINLGGGFRINLSKSGIGYSWGVKGYRVTKTANGKIRRTYSIPGTGISYVEDTPKTKKVIPKQTDARTLTIGDTTYFKSENLDEMSKNDIVLEKLDNIHKLNYIANILCMLIVFIPIGLIIKGIIALYGKIYLDYEFDGYSEEKNNVLNTIIEEMNKNQKIWRVNTSVKNADLKYSSGATNSITRTKIKIYKGTPWYLKSNVDVYYISIGNEKVYLTPDRIIIFKGFKVRGCKYNNLDFDISNSRYIEEEVVPKDAKIISYTWKYVNKNGGPDKRFNNNRQLPICDYGRLSVTSNEGINFRIQCSNIYIMAEVSKHLNKFVEIINKEINSENTYYNFEEDETIIYNDKEEKIDNNDKNLTQVEDNKILEENENIIDEPNLNNTDIVIKKIKKGLKMIGLGVELFFAFIFVIISLANNMFFAGICWIIFGSFSIIAYKKHKVQYRIINIIIFFVAFCILILCAPKAYNGKYKSNSNNTQIILNNNKAEIILENGVKLSGNITYKIKDNKIEISVNIKENNTNFYYIFDRDNENLLENENIYYMIEKN